MTIIYDLTTPPLLYLAILLGIVLLFAIRSVLDVYKMLHETGIPFSMSMISVNFNGLLKWASANDIKVAVLIFILVISGIIWVVNFSL